jgi:hypothetical protein
VRSLPSAISALIFFVLFLQAFAELHQKLTDTTHKMKLADEEISCLKMSMHHARLTDSEITVSLCLQDKTFKLH